MLFRPHPEISVIIPAHNEADNLPTLIDEIEQVARDQHLNLEIVVVDDASGDETPKVLEVQESKHGNLSVFRLAWQSGQSAALAAGFDKAKGDILVTIDADLQNDPRDIPRLLAQLDSADVAIGWRRDRKDPFSKRIISKVANKVRNWMTGESVRDTGCGLKAFKRECVERIHRFDGMHRFFPTLAKMHQFKVAEVPVHHRPRTRGRTHYNIFNRSIRPMADLLAVRWLQRRALRYHVQQEMACVHH